MGAGCQGQLCTAPVPGVGRSRLQAPSFLRCPSWLLSSASSSEARLLLTMPAHSPGTMQPRSAPALPAAVRTAGQSLQDPFHPAPSTTRQPSFVSARTQHSSGPAALRTQSVQRRSCAQRPNTPHTVQLLCAAQMPRNHGLPSSSAQKSPREDELCPRVEGQDVPQLCDHGQAAQIRLYPGS